MITRQQIDRLLQFDNGEYLVTSCYLNLDRAKMPPQMLKIRVKDLIQAAEHDLTAKAASHAQRESLRADFAEIESLVRQHVATSQARGLAIFSCTGDNFWQAY